jgi:ribosomal protein S18 acetylase RimI-like enzyme
MPANPLSIKLRAEEPADAPFLLEVYASTRQEELEATGWPAAMREQFVRMQGNAQQQGYRASYPRAEFAIILRGEEPVGRMVVNRAEDEILLVDIALLPTHCGRGIGTALLRKLLDEAAATAKPVRLSVIRGQRASRLYQRLGFEKTGETEIRDQLEWRHDRRSLNQLKPCAPA